MLFAQGVAAQSQSIVKLLLNVGVGFRGVKVSLTQMRCVVYDWRRIASDCDVRFVRSEIGYVRYLVLVLVRNMYSSWIIEQNKESFRKR